MLLSVAFFGDKKKSKLDLNTRGKRKKRIRFEVKSDGIEERDKSIVIIKCIPGAATDDDVGHWGEIGNPLALAGGGVAHLLELLIEGASAAQRPLE